MFSSSRKCFALAALLLVGMAATASAVVSGPVPLTGILEVDFQQVQWNQNTDQTEFIYTTNLKGPADLAHLIFAPSTDTSCLRLSAKSQETYSLRTEPLTGTFGFVEETGQPVSVEVRKYRLTFDGKVGSASIRVVALLGDTYGEFTLPGPDCLADNDYPAVTLLGSDATVECPRETPQTTSRDAVQIQEGRCPVLFVEHHLNYEFGTNGLFSLASYDISVVDTTSPVFEAANRTHIVECGQPLPVITDPVATDACDLNPTVTSCEERTDSPCGNYVVVKTWTATDHCGNTECVTVTTVVQDTRPPVFVSVPEDLVLNCTDAVPPGSVSDAIVEDECDDNVTVTYSETEIQGECGNTREIQRRWTAVDRCGNRATALQVISVIDLVKPVLTLEVVPSTFECDETVQVPQVNATDACQTEAPEVPAPTTATIGDDTCAYFVRYTWDVTDECWNTATVTHLVTIRDSQDPMFVEATLPPATLTVQCRQVPPAATPQCRDACHNTSIVFSETNATTECDSQYVINRTWTCTDACGHSTAFTQIISVVDTVDPTLSGVPADTTVQCAADVPCPPAVTASDNCGSIDLDYNETDNGASRCDYILTRTWNGTDCAGNSVVDSATVRVRDTTAPGLAPEPADASEACDDLQGAPEVRSYDNCACPWDGSGAAPNCLPVVLAVRNESVLCPGNYTIVRNWTVADSCGNDYSYEQRVTVTDTTNPVFDAHQSTYSSACQDPADRPTLTATDSCGSASVTPLPERRVNGSCPNTYTLYWDYTATDECGNTASATVTSYVSDNTPPTLSGVPAATTVECDEVPCPADVTGEDECDGLILAYAETRTNGSCPQSYTLTRTWTATDACGHSVTESQTITVRDTEAPLWNGTIADYSATCDNVTFPELPSVSDNCGAVRVTEHHSRTNGNCTDRYTLHRAFKAADECGNAAWLNYTVTVSDDEAPVLSGVPSDDSNECTLPPAGPFSAQDNCDLNPWIHTPADTEVSRSCPHNFVVVRTFTASDRCGNSDSQNQTLTVYDNTPPAFTPAQLNDVSNECELPASYTVPTAGDVCSGAETPVLTVTELSRTCAHRFVKLRSWYVVDDCGNDATLNHTVTVYDNTAPTLTGVPADTTVECTAVPCPPSVTARDNCDGVNLDYDEVRTNGSCPQSYTLTRTWTATDACDESYTESQTITVRDTHAPTFPAPPADSTVSCSFTEPQPPAGQDNCDPDFTRTPHSSTVPGSCDYDYVRHVAYLYEDACGNSDWYNYTVTVQDIAAPTIIGWVPAAPADGATYTTTNDGCDFPAYPTPVLDDNCYDAPTSSPFEDIVPSQSCPIAATRTVTYTLVDSCNNTATYSFSDSIVHDKDPEWLSQLPGNGTQECPYTQPAAETLVCIDACGGRINATLAEETLPGSCPQEYTLRRTWTCADVCGRSIVHVQDVAVEDNTPPTFSRTIQDYSESNKCEAQPIRGVNASDACDPEPQVTQNKTEVSRECLYRYVEQHNDYAVDACGNPASQSRLVNYTWNVQPTLSGVPLDVEQSCEAPLPPHDVTAKDGCGVDLTPVFNETITDADGPQDCPNSYVLQRSWTATDDCGVSATGVQIITVVDRTRPTLSGDFVPELTVECGFVPGYPNITAVDNCGGVVVTLVVADDAEENCCTRTITRTWSGVDACGNQADDLVQTIHVVDTIPPELHNVPPSKQVECPYTLEGDNVTAANPALAVGWCLGAGAVENGTCGLIGAQPALAGVPTPSGPVDLEWEGGHAIRWNDAVGKAFVRGFAVEASDPSRRYEVNLEFSTFSHGDLSGSQELDSACYASGQVNASTWRFYSAVAGNVTGVAGTATASFPLYDISAFSAGEVLQLGKGAGGVSAAHGLRARFAAPGGASVVLRAELTQDGEATCVLADYLYPRNEQTGSAAYPELECNDTIPITTNLTIVNQTCPNEYDIIRCWTATDESGNSVSACQIIQVRDNTAPRVVFPDGAPSSAITLQCGDSFPPVNYTAEDDCGPAYAVETVGQPYDQSQTCPHDYYVDRTWTAYDECNQSTPVTQTAHYVDNTDPVLYGVPQLDGSFDCDETPQLPTVTADDNCDGVLTVLPSEGSRVALSSPTCPNHYQVTWTYSATDACGNDVQDSWSYTVTDTTPPTIQGVPQDTTLPCGSALPPATVTCPDDCSTTSLSGPELSWTNTSDCTYEVVRTWTCSDACGNTATPVSQTIRFTDTVDPQLQNEPQDTTIECSEAVPAQANLSASDNCDLSVDVVPTSRVEDQTCSHNYTRVYRWVATDCAGNEDEHEQRIVVRDTNAPTLSGVPPAASYQCRAQVPCPADVTANDNCAGVDLEYTQTGGQNQGCNDRTTIVRTWTATDDCGLSHTESQTITVDDSTDPECEPFEDTTVTCVDFVDRSALQPTCSDNCNGALTYTPHHASEPGTACDYAEHYNWLVTDPCGNSVWVNYTVTVVSAGPLTFAGVADDETFECMFSPPTPPTASQPCLGAVTVTTTPGQPVDEGCTFNYSITYRYTATDCAGEEHSESTTYTARDTQAPTIGQVPDETTVNCTWTPPVDVVMCTDGCQGSFPASYVDDYAVVQGCVNRDVTRTWTCTDACGHSTSASQVVHIRDTVAPELANVPPPATQECDAVDLTHDVTASDNCDVTVQVVEGQLPVDDGDNCVDSYIVNQTFTATDACGNVDFDSRLVTVVDTTDPYFDVPACGGQQPSDYCDSSAECNALPNPPMNPPAGDNCDGSVDVTPFPGRVDGPCLDTYTLTYAYRAVDNCGNDAWLNFSVSVHDTQAPSFDTFPEDTTEQCYDLQGVDQPTAGDNCANTVLQPGTEYFNYTESSTYVPGTCANYVITRTWTIRDRCGNSDNATQTITVVDDQAPTFVGQLPEDFTVQCHEDPMPDTLSAMDTCGSANVSFSRVPIPDQDGCGSLRQEQWVWVARDLCGNEANHTIVVTWIDTQDPTLSGVPQDTTAECGSVPCPASVTAHDNCVGLTLEFDESEVPGPCDGARTITRTWVGTDCAGNSVNDSQTITVVDTTDPTFDGPAPVDTTLECTETPAQETYTCQDSCSDCSVTEGPSSPVPVPGDCPANYDLVYTWTATDACGNDVGRNQTVHVRDTVPPTVVPADPLCLLSVFDGTLVTIEHASDNGVLFAAADACSAVTIAITGCRSNQDALLGVTPVGPGGAFNSHCYYDGATDTLTIVPIVDPTVPAGRVFVVDAVVTDACGNPSSNKTQIYIPYDSASPSHLGELTGEFALPPDFDAARCAPNTLSCVGFCPCEVDDAACVEGAAYDSLLITPVSSNGGGMNYDAASDTTTWSYHLSGPAGAVDTPRVVLGFDLSRLEVVGTSPAGLPVELGAASDTFLSGVVFDTRQVNSSVTLAVTFRGNAAESAAHRVPAQIGGGLDITRDCSEVRSLRGPNYGSLSYRAGNSVSGRVYVVGTLSGDDETARVPLAGVIVDLVQKDNPVRTVIASTMTAADGSYAFHDVGADASVLGVAVAADGFLRPGATFTTGTPGELFTAEVVDPVAQEWPFGTPQAVSFGAGNDVLTIKFDDTARPRYVRVFAANQADKGFGGDAQTASYWCYQLSGLVGAETSPRIAALAAEAQLPACGVTASLCSSASSALDELKLQLLAARLNNADGRGISQPFDVLNQVFPSLAEHVACTLGASASAADLATATELLDRLNGASSPN